MMPLFHWTPGCWSNDPHKRPTFKEIQHELDKIVRSGFTETPNESFHTMQDGWKKEIAEVLEELRIKEKVSVVHVMRITREPDCQMYQRISDISLFVSLSSLSLYSLFDLCNCWPIRRSNHLKR